MVYQYPKSIPDAAKLLDEVKPGWANQINLDKLYTAGDACILGQLYGMYWTGMNSLFGSRDSYAYGVGPSDKIFGCSWDRELWLNEIKIRANIFDHSFAWALKTLLKGKKVRHISFVPGNYIKADEQGLLTDKYGHTKLSVKELQTWSSDGWSIVEDDIYVKVGDRLKFGGNEYMIVNPYFHKASLINLSTGIRWCDPVDWNGCSPINLNTLVAKHYIDKFTLVK